MPRLLLTGTYCSKNKGDAALFISMADELRRLRPGLEIVVGSPFSHLDRPLYEPLGIRVASSDRRKLGRCLLQMGLARWLPFLLSHPRTADLEWIAAADAVVDLSGDGLTEDYGPHVVLSHLYPIWAALELGRPVALCSQTIGPFRWTSSWAQQVLDRVDLITPRDRFTSSYLEELGVRRPRLELVADIAHLLAPAPTESLSALLEPYPQGFFERPVLGVTVSRLLGNRQSLGPNPTRRFSEMAQGIGMLAERHGWSVLLLSHSTGPRPARDDRPAAKLLLERLNLPGRVHFEERDLEPSTIKSLIGRCSIFLGMRLHSVIAALSMGVPSVTLGYGPKAQGLLEHWEQTERCLAVAAEPFGPRLLNLLEGTWLEREAIGEHLRARSPVVLERARSSARHVLESLLKVKYNVSKRPGAVHVHP